MQRIVHIFLFFCLFIMVFPLFAGGKNESSHTLNVYCYDSFKSDWGPGPYISEAFTEETGIRLLMHAPGDAVTVLNQLILEKNAPQADVVVGLDNSLLSRALEEKILIPYQAKGIASIDENLIFDKSYHLLPYDYGHFAINYDSLALAVPPKSLEDLTREEFQDKLILMDPRTSTPGLGFLLWTVEVYGGGWKDYWKRLNPSILSVTSSWSQAYALFTAGEAPMVLSYGTSPVYHAEYEENTRFQAAEFTEGHVRQVEGMGIVRGTKKREMAQRFIEFMLEVDSQEIVAMYNIMLPVNSGVSLPPSFNFALVPNRNLDMGVLKDQNNIDEVVNSWVEVFTP